MSLLFLVILYLYRRSYRHVVVIDVITFVEVQKKGFE